MFLKSISRVAVYSRIIKNRGPSLLTRSFKHIRELNLYAYRSSRSRSSTSRFDTGTVITRTMSDAISKKTEEDTRQKSEEADANSRSTSSKDETTAKEGSSKEKSSEEDSSTLKYATREGFLKEHQKSVKESKDKFLSMPKDEKRKLYKCKGKFVLLSEIQTWPELFENELVHVEDINRWWKKNKKHVSYDVKENLNKKISLFCGDITALEIDAIVNAANESLLGGGGVDGAIHAAAGPHLRSECELLHGCKGGEAKITCGYKLPAKHVIHTVGPRGEYPQILEDCYLQCLELVKENQLKSVAFPCISTGIFGYPNDKAAIVALQTVRNWLEIEDYAEHIERIIFCLFLQKDLDVYHKETQIFFPLKEKEATD